MESLFKLTELETRVPLNMNVLSRGQVPNVLGLRQVLREWLDHRQVVLVRRSKFRLAKIDHRLEVLDGYLIVYLNIDKVIKIIREKDEPKPALMKAFKLSDVQAEAILNMRLRSLRKLEEIEIKREHDKLTKERKELKALLASRGQAVEDDRRRDQGAEGSVRPEDRARQAPHELRRRARGRRDRARRGDDREGAGDRRPLGEGLDPRHQAAIRPSSTASPSRKATG